MVRQKFLSIEKDEIQNPDFKNLKMLKNLLFMNSGELSLCLFFNFHYVVCK